MKQFFRRFLVGLGVVILLSITAFIIWASLPARPTTTAINSLATTGSVTYEQINQWLVFTPQHREPNLGFVFYPGGHVDEQAYAAHARAIASQGFRVVVVPMPLHFAFLGVNAADDVIAAFPLTTRWVIGGHSLGGAMAATYASQNPDQIAGLVLWAAYPAGSADLSQSGLPVLSIYASNDGLATAEDIAASVSLLPAGTTFVEIAGGNHAGFGWYGDQNGDGERTIPQVAQQEQIVTVTVNFLNRIP